MKAQALLELLFPSTIYCISCKSLIDKSRPYALCDSCMRMFHWANGRTCEKCGKLLQEDYPHDICADCREAGHCFDKGYACVEYGIYERDMLLSFKYGGKTFIGEKIAQMMADRLESEHLEADVMIPVPMNRKKQKKRGFNQAEIIASRLAKKLSLPYSAGLLKRTGNTAAMSKLTPEERRMNIENAFKVPEMAIGHIAGKRILLVDDIYTTGSTMDACSRALKEAGASEVRFVAFASGANLLIWDKAAAQACG